MHLNSIILIKLMIMRICKVTFLWFARQQEMAYPCMFQRRSTRLGEKEAAGKKVTWEPRTQAPVEWDTAPMSPTRATRVPLARQPQPPLSPPPCRPSTSQARAPIRRVDKPDYGRSGDGVKFLVSSTPEPFGDLEPGTTKENEPPA